MTQQAADILGVSRPTVVCLIDDGELPADRVGNRRRLLLKNVLDYREFVATASTEPWQQPESTSARRNPPRWSMSGSAMRKAISERRHRGKANA